MIYLNNLFSPTQLVMLGFFIALIVIIIFNTIKIYNILIKKDTEIQTQQGHINTALQKREDLVAQLSVLTKEASVFEKLTQTDSARLRNSGKNAGFIATAENYPRLNSIISNFTFFQEQIADVETSLRKERIDYNILVGDFKGYVRSFPTFLVAYPLGYKQDKYDIFSTHAFDKPKFWEKQ